MVEAFIAHHSETDEPYNDEDARAQIAGIHHFHKTVRGWPGFAYNGAVWQSTYYRVRNANRKGWHSAGADYDGNGIGDWNEKGFAVVMLGWYTFTQPDERTLKTLLAAKALEEAEVFSGRRLELRGHMDGWPTQCPGAWWPAWKSEVT